MKNYNDSIRYRTLDLLACSAVPQPISPPRDYTHTHTHTCLMMTSWFQNAQHFDINKTCLPLSLIRYQKIGEADEGSLSFSSVTPGQCRAKSPPALSRYLHMLSYSLFPQSVQANAGLSHCLLVSYVFICSAMHCFLSHSRPVPGEATACSFQMSSYAQLFTVSTVTPGQCRSKPPPSRSRCLPMLIYSLILPSFYAI